MPEQAKHAQNTNHRHASETTPAAGDYPCVEKPEAEPTEDERRLMRRKRLGKYGFNPKSDGHFPVTKELVNQIREGLGI